jgi:hypothetical protein
MAIDISAIMQSIHDNADWAEARSLTKAKAFATAARRYLMLTPQQSSQPGGFSTTLGAQQIKEMLDEANEFINANTSADGSDTSGSATVRLMGVRHGFR